MKTVQFESHPGDKSNTLVGFCFFLLLETLNMKKKDFFDKRKKKDRDRHRCEVSLLTDAQEQPATLTDKHEDLYIKSPKQK